MPCESKSRKLFSIFLSILLASSILTLIQASTSFIEPHKNDFPRIQYTNTTVFSDGFEAYNFNLWTDGGTTSWGLASLQKHSGLYSAICGASQDGNLTSDNIDMSGTTTRIYLSFWFRDDDLDNGDGYLRYYDGSTYDQILDLNSITGDTEDTWIQYRANITDSQYFISTFRIQFTETPETGENAWVDDVYVNKIVSDKPTYTNLVPANNYISEGDETLIFNATWQSDEGMSQYIFSWNATPQITYLGKTDNGTTEGTHLADAKRAQRYVFPNNGKLYRISLYARRATAGSTPVRVGVYTGTPTTLYANSSEVTITSMTYAWYNFTLTPAKNVYKGTAYWFTFITDAELRYRYTAISQQYHVYDSSDLYPDFETTWSGVSRSSVEMNIYATYNVSANEWLNSTTYSWAGSPTTAGSNVSKDLTEATFQGQWIKWKIYAKTAFSEWNVTSERVFFWWESLPDISKFEVGLGSFESTSNFFYNSTDTGGRPALYFTYINSSTGTSLWHNFIRAYDYGYSNWTQPYDMGPAGSTPETANNLHYTISLGKLPDGRLIFSKAHNSALNITLSTYNASTTANLYQLISNWQPAMSFTSASQTPYAGSFSYSWFALFSNTTLILGKDGAPATGAYYSYYRWVHQDRLDSYVASFTNGSSGTSRFRIYGSTPYLNEETVDYIISDTGAATVPSIKYFYARIDNTPYSGNDYRQWYNSTNPKKNFQPIYLWVYAKGTSTGVQIRPLVWNTTDYTLSSQALTTNFAWYSWDITPYINYDNLGEGSGLQPKFGIEVSAGYSTGNATIQTMRVSFNNMTGLAPAYRWIKSDSTLSPYILHNQGNDGKIVSAGDDYNVSSGLRRNVLFLYDDNRGKSWKMANGTSLGQFTISTASIRVLSEIRSATIQTSGRGLYAQDTNIGLSITHVFDYSTPRFSRRIELVYYNKSLGTSGGSWIRKNATLEDGSIPFSSPTTLGGSWSYDKYYERIGAWLPNGTNKLSKYISMPNNISKFRAIWTDPSQNVSSTFGWAINQSPEGYESVVREQRPVAGKTSFGANNATSSYGYSYGTKFTASFTGYLTTVAWWVHPKTLGATGAIQGQAAVYNSSFYLLGNTSTTIITGGYIHGWTSELAFTTPPLLTEGQPYWIFFNHMASGNTNIGYLWDTGTTNQTIEYASSSFANQLNMSLVTYQNRAITVYGYQVTLMLRGSGIVDRPHFSDYATTPPIVIVGQTGTFSVYVTSPSSLTTSTFYWNVSGSFAVAGTNDWNNSYSTETWDNFTLTIPGSLDSNDVIAWYVDAYNSVGSYNVSDIRNTEVGIQATAVLSWGSSISWTLFALKNLLVIFSWVTSQVWTVLVNWVSNVLASWVNSQTFTLLTQPTFKILIIWTETMQWLLTVKQVQVVDVFLAWALGQSWTFLAQWNAQLPLSWSSSQSWLLLVSTSALNIVDLNWLLTQSWTLSVQWVTSIDFSWITSQTWQLLAPTLFKVVLSFPQMVAWTLTVYVGVLNTVVLTWQTIFTWYLVIPVISGGLGGGGVGGFGPFPILPGLIPTFPIAPSEPAFVIDIPYRHLGVGILIVAVILIFGSLSKKPRGKQKWRSRRRRSSWEP